MTHLCQHKSWNWKSAQICGSVCSKKCETNYHLPLHNLTQLYQHKLRNFESDSARSKKCETNYPLALHNLTH